MGRRGGGGEKGELAGGGGVEKGFMHDDIGVF